ncbi:hypothetical protein HZS_5670 [Henneguya salminicola]|nr:hypothetical protein HZS_5670 [Henneguya salminicola]
MVTHNTLLWFGRKLRILKLRRSFFSNELHENFQQLDKTHYLHKVDEFNEYNPFLNNIVIKYTYYMPFQITHVPMALAKTYKSFFILNIDKIDFKLRISIKKCIHTFFNNFFHDEREKQIKKQIYCSKEATR